MPPAVTVEDLGVVFDKRLHALSGVTFSVGRGEIVALVGESGSGKSTVGRVLTGLVRPTTGRVSVEGKVQMVFQDPFGSLNPVHTIAHHVQRPLIRHGKATRASARQRALELLDLVGLAPAEAYADKHPHELSGGQRQRVAIARALAPEPDVLVADEPTSMLDVSIRMDVLRLLDRLRGERGLAVLLVTHDLAAARYLADRVLVLYSGQLMEEAPADRLGRDPRHPYTRLLVAAAPRPGADIHAPLPARPGLPQNIDPPPGCPFAPRCHDAVPACRTRAPRAHRVGPDHHVRCEVHR